MAKSKDDLSLLSHIHGPEDIKSYSMLELTNLVREIREQIITTVSQNGGHLASSLGVVELTVALHRAFDSPRDKIIWDVGHQSYAHKLITGRYERFHTLRRLGGISGFPIRTESPHDCFGTGHASTSISAALGMAYARDLSGGSYHIVSVIGDGALTAGLAFEGLNHAGHAKKDIIVILNDNEMAISRSVGALSSYLNKVVTGSIYNRAKADIKYVLQHLPKIGSKLYETASRLEETMVLLLTPGVFFEELGFKYFGPVDGHNLQLLMDTLENVKHLKGPRMLHVVTRKGRGYAPAEDDPTSFHGARPFEVKTGKWRSSAPFKVEREHEIKEHPTYTEVFRDTILQLAKEEPKLVAITAAMSPGTGLDKFAEQFPDRFCDVGIAEQHAVTLAAGMACQGLRPVVAIYSTFLQRAFDQVVHDVCLQNLPVVFAIDRAGIVGDDGPTHHGCFDIGFLRGLPNMVLAAPANEAELAATLRWAIRQPGPVALRYPRSQGMGISLSGEEEIRLGCGTLLREGSDAAIIALGSMVVPALEAATELDADGITVAVANARFVKPLDEELLGRLARMTNKLIAVEEHAVAGGFGSAVLDALERLSLTSKICVHRLGIPDKFVEQGPRSILLSQLGLDSEGIARSVRAALWERNKNQRLRLKNGPRRTKVIE